MISNELLGEVEGQIEGELEGYLEAVRKAKYPNAVIPPDVKDVALAVGRQSSRRRRYARPRAYPRYRFYAICWVTERPNDSKRRFPAPTVYNRRAGHDSR